MIGTVAALLLSATPPPFDATRVEVDGRLRLEARAGLWLTQQASRLRTTQPSVGLGLSLRPLARLRLDTGYGFTMVTEGSEQLSVTNTLHALRARGHYAHPVGGVWLTFGGGPVGYLVTSSLPELSQAPEVSVRPALGGELALGAETEVSRRLLRFEAAVATRDRRWDLHAVISVGF